MQFKKEGERKEEKCQPELKSEFSKIFNKKARAC
jgi:hypothetical protein